MTVIFNVQDQSADNSLYQRAANSDLPIADMLDGTVRYRVPADVIDYVMAADLPDDEFEAPGNSVWIEWHREGVDVGFLLREHIDMLNINAIKDFGRGPEPYVVGPESPEDALLVLGFIVGGGDDARKVVVRQVPVGGNEVRMVSFAALS